MSYEKWHQPFHQPEQLLSQCVYNYMWERANIYDKNIVGNREIQCSWFWVYSYCSKPSVPSIDLFFNPFPHTINRLWNYQVKNIENLYKLIKWKYDYWIELKSLWQIEKLLIMSSFSICHHNFKSRLLQRRQKVSTWGKGLKDMDPFQHKKTLQQTQNKTFLEMKE